LTSTCPLCESSLVTPYAQVHREYCGRSFRLRLVQCKQCCFVYLLDDPQITYDQDYLEKENVLTSSDPLAHFRFHERLARIALLIPPDPEKCFLDIGIGDGLLLHLAEKLGYRTFGLDVNPAAVESALDQFGLHAELSLSPIEVAFSNYKFEVIHMNEVIEHAAQPMKIIHWCREHLSRQGCLVVQTGNIDSAARLIRRNGWLYFRPVHVSYFSTRTLLYALEKAGFRILHCSTNDWRITPSITAFASLWKQGQKRHALNFVSQFLTSLIHGVRGTVLVYAN
jgi:2-polyprenyl-3-methyl-5-hydroxy-6-metoxy-1,4-benzoquinol methylase